MKQFLLIFSFFLLFTSITLSNLSANSPVFVSPVPNSEHVKIASAIILRFDENPLRSYLNDNLIQISGSKSGVIKADVKISSDSKTIIFTPEQKFNFNEVVTVSIKPIKNTRGAFSDEVNYSFTTEKKDIKPEAFKYLMNEIESHNSNENITVPVPMRQDNSTLPADFPEITVTTNINPSPGYIFLSNFTLTPLRTPYYLMILDNTGTPIFYRNMDTACYDFRKNLNGNLTYFDGKGQKFYEMNNRYEIIDSFACGNGYTTDLHEFLVYPNGHSFLMSYDPQLVDMSDYIANGNPNATVIGLIIQELDANKNVIFQWRSWDHMNILDANHLNFTLAEIDYAHGNAIELDNDGNIMISSRHLSEITKINRNTGEMMWRFGGKRNQFDYINEDWKFSWQHAIRRAHNGNVTIFDNNNFPERTRKEEPVVNNSQAPYSRVVEYELNEVTRIATRVWEYRNSPDVYAFAMGYSERLDNGNTIIGWGAGNTAFTEVNAAGEKVFELTLPAGMVSYRAFKSEWTPSPDLLPQTHTLYQNYPNPFNPVTTIKFDIPQQSEVKINIYNMLGQKMQEINRGTLAAGTHEYQWNAVNFSSGIYFYQIHTNSFTQTKKMTLVK